MSSLRVLWLSPWMRPLARVQADALRRRGVDVLLLTTDHHHPEADAARDYEVVLDPRVRTPATWPACCTAWRKTREHRPDVVIAELVNDPRWIAIAGGAPRIQLIHDDSPKDALERRPGYERTVFDRWSARSAATVTYSHHVAATVAARRDVAGTPVRVMPLPTDLSDGLVPPLVKACDRRDFVMIGRLNPYKNLDVVLRAWHRHVTGPGWRGDELVLIGEGQVDPAALPAHTRWRAGKYRYVDILGELAAAKGSIVHYRRASQSGVQVVSMQLGVTPIVSAVGGLPEFQPPACPPIGVDDVAGLAAALDELADPETAALRGVDARRHYDRRFAVERTTDRLLGIIDAVLDARSPDRSTGKRAADTSARARSR